MTQRSANTGVSNDFGHLCDMEVLFYATKVITSESAESQARKQNDHLYEKPMFYVEMVSNYGNYITYCSTVLACRPCFRPSGGR